MGIDWKTPGSSASMDVDITWDQTTGPRIMPVDQSQDNVNINTLPGQRQSKRKALEGEAGKERKLVREVVPKDVKVIPGQAFFPTGASTTATVLLFNLWLWLCITIRCA